MCFMRLLWSKLRDWFYNIIAPLGASTIIHSEGMYRLSNHWGRFANSKWRLGPLEPATSSKFKVGFARWEDFYPDNAEDKLYYIAADYAKRTVNYQHKQNPNYDPKAVLRTSFETTKRSSKFGICSN